mgnify:CR=1 FL=1
MHWPGFRDDGALILPLEQAGYGFQLVAEAQDSIKVIIEPHGHA